MQRSVLEAIDCSQRLTVGVAQVAVMLLDRQQPTLVVATLVSQQQATDAVGQQLEYRAHLLRVCDR